MKPDEAMVDRAQLLRSDWAGDDVLVGGLRVLGANAGDSKHGVFTKEPGKLTNDFFVSLLTMNTSGSRSPAPRACTRAATARPTRSSGPHPRRPDLRFALAAAGVRGGLCVRGREGEVREGLRGGVDQGDERRSFRPCLIFRVASATENARAASKSMRPFVCARPVRGIPQPDCAGSCVFGDAAERWNLGPGPPRMPVAGGLIVRRPKADRAHRRVPARLQRLLAVAWPLSGSFMKSFTIL